ncbi:MAG: hypothetical protein ACI8RD_005828 [Bacillariaceae sp.]
MLKQETGKLKEGNKLHKYKIDIKNKVKRQAQVQVVVKPDVSDEEIDDIMKSEGGRDAMYKQSILAGGINDEIKTTYANVAGRVPRRF